MNLSASDGVGWQARLALVQFYREFNPTKLHEIETILNRYEGSYTRPCSHASAHHGAKSPHRYVSACSRRRSFRCSTRLAPLPTASPTSLPHPRCSTARTCTARDGTTWPSMHVLTTAPRPSPQVRPGTVPRLFAPAPLLCGDGRRLCGHLPHPRASHVLFHSPRAFRQPRAGACACMPSACRVHAECVLGAC